jgi:Rhodopirellula transposase DDE domain
MTRPGLSAEEERWLRVLSTLNEAQQRWYVADKALDMGRGGITRLSDVAGMSRTTITKAIAEVTGSAPLREGAPGFPVRRPGGGRRKIEEVDPALLRELEVILKETTAGDPMSLLRWTTKSTRGIADELTRRGHPITWHTVGRCLHDLGYSLQANVKTLEGKQHPARDAQFRYINRQVKNHLKTGDPVISVDAKKKELIGAFRNAGRTWRKQGQPEQVNGHDFPHLAEGKGLPYGAYDVAADRAVVSVGVSHDTAAFAVESIRRWWRLDGRRLYPLANRLLICADGGGSNGSRLRAWKFQIQKFADDISIPITVCHYAPGTSKWNKIEHRLFSFISMSWKGQPLRSYASMINLIRATRTRTGLSVKAVLDTNQYATGIKVSKEQFRDVNIERHRIHPDWNYTITPAK